jgi:hypothetical protein
MRLLCKALDRGGLPLNSDRSEKTALARYEECGGNQGTRLEIATIRVPPPRAGAVGLVFVVAHGDIHSNLVDELWSQVNHDAMGVPTV